MYTVNNHGSNVAKLNAVHLSLKALGGVDHTKYALLAITQYVQWLEIGKVKNAVNLSKVVFIIKLLHIFNMSVTNLQSIKMIH